jgi:3-methyladenine DNA glycosylase/8-oxoguanine DNA glycosylase
MSQRNYFITPFGNIFYEAIRGVRKGFQLAYKKRKLPTPEQLERFGKKWKPYRTIATLYLWGAADFINLNEW